MGKIYFGEKTEKTVPAPQVQIREVEVIKEVFLQSPPEIREVIKEVPIEVIKYVDVLKEVEVIKEIQVVKEVQVPFEVKVEVIKEKLCELKHCECKPLTNTVEEQKDNRFKYLLPLLYALAGALLTRLF